MARQLEVAEQGTAFFETIPINLRPSLFPENQARGTESSNLSSSAGESVNSGCFDRDRMF